MASKDNNKKKNKPYYKTQNKQNSQNNTEKNKNNEAKMNSLYLGVGFIIYFASRYIFTPAYASVFSIVGLAISSIGVYNMAKKDKEEEKKVPFIVDMLFFVAIIILIILKILEIYKIL